MIFIRYKSYSGIFTSIHNYITKTSLSIVTSQYTVNSSPHLLFVRFENMRKKASFEKFEAGLFDISILLFPFETSKLACLQEILTGPWPFPTGLPRL